MSNSVPRAGRRFDTSGLHPCAYVIWLTATVKLTSGYGLIGGVIDPGSHRHL